MTPLTSPHSPAPIDVFISYSHKDDDLRAELDIHLSNLKRQGKIAAWHDRAIEAGTEWEAQIKAKLESAPVILLLISPPFMASNYCYDVEMERVIERHNEGTARVIPIILRPCDWQDSPFSKLQVLPKEGKPVTLWVDRDSAFLDVVQGIRRAIESLQKKVTSAQSILAEPEEELERISEKSPNEQNNEQFDSATSSAEQALQPIDQTCTTFSQPKMNRRRWSIMAGAFVVVSIVGNFFKNGIINPWRNKPIDQSLIHSFEFEVVKLDVHSIVERKYKGTAQKITEELSNAINLEMVRIPEGIFLMGSPESDRNSIDNERPIHKVSVDSIYMSRYPITQEQYKALMGNNPSHFKGEKLPVEHVSRENAQIFCRKLSELSKRKYRLPSEAEWEYACRAGTKTPYCFGEVISDKFANCNRSNSQTSLVGSFPANDFGLQDMHGNVWEWCEDNWHEDYNEAPINGKAWLNEKNNVQILRGGSWDYGLEYCRSAFRGNHYLGNLHGYNGFRVVLEIT